MTNKPNITNESIQPTAPRDTEATVQKQPDRTQFQAYMQEGATVPQKAGQAPPGVSPMEVAGQAAMQTAGPNVNTLLAQVNSAQGTINDMQAKLNQNPDLKMKRQHQYLMQNKLQDANGHMQAANNRMGAPMQTPQQLAADAGPIEKFLAYLTDGQNQMNAANKRLQEIGKSNQQLNPAELLVLQVQLGQAQQELDYASTLLSKVIDVFKQMLNIQM